MRHYAAGAAVGVLTLLAGCGASTTTVTVAGTPSPGPSSGTGSGSTSASVTDGAGSSSAAVTTTGGTGGSSSTGGGGLRPVSIVWAVRTASGVTVRSVPVAGGGAHDVAHLGTGAVPISGGHGRLVVENGDTHTLDVISIDSGATVSTPLNGSAPGAAVSPDGNRVAFIDSAAGASSLRVLDIASHAATTLQTFTGQRAPAPYVWAANAIGAVDIVPAADAGPQGVEALNPANGSPVATQTLTGGLQATISGDAAHAIFSSHDGTLGDDGDQQPDRMGPPANTLNTLPLTPGAHTPTVIRQRAHHDMIVLGTLPEASSTLIDDAPTAGGFAGISMSPEFGLLAVSASGTTTQYMRESGTRYDSGTFLQDGSTVVVGTHDASGAHLLRISAGALSSTPLDTVSGGLSSLVELDL